MKGLLIGLLLLAGIVLAVEPMSALPEPSRVRIAYFALDPRSYDTYLDGQIASFNNGWDYSGWREPVPYAQVVCCTSTPYMDMAGGDHVLFFVPKGEGATCSTSGPFAVTLAPGHIYSLGLIGAPENGSLNLLAIDETDTSATVNTATHWRGYVVNDLTSAHPVTLQEDDGDIALEHGQYALDTQAESTAEHVQYTALQDDETHKLLVFETVPLPPEISDFSAITGHFPGRWGTDYAWAYNWGFPGHLALTDGGTVSPGTAVSGSVTELGSRVQYQLTLAEETTLNITVRGTGEPTHARTGLASSVFDPTLYLTDADGHLLVWNEEMNWRDNADSVFDAGFQRLTLPAGTYTVSVGGTIDSQAGPFELSIETYE
ncbi:MAG: DVUA0089 family protein [Anaerolineae bacterium]